MKENFFLGCQTYIVTQGQGSHFNFQVPKITTHSSGSFYYNAIANWNRLPDDIKSIPLKSAFKRSVKTRLLIIWMYSLISFFYRLVVFFLASLFHLLNIFKGHLWK